MYSRGSIDNLLVEYKGMPFCFHGSPDCMPKMVPEIQASPCMCHVDFQVCKLRADVDEVPVNSKDPIPWPVIPHVCHLPSLFLQTSHPNPVCTVSDPGHITFEFVPPEASRARSSDWPASIVEPPWSNKPR